MHGTGTEVGKGNRNLRFRADYNSSRKKFQALSFNKIPCIQTQKGKKICKSLVQYKRTKYLECLVETLSPAL
jgi:hypothetical protein